MSQKLLRQIVVAKTVKTNCCSKTGSQDFSAASRCNCCVETLLRRKIFGVATFFAPEDVCAVSKCNFCVATCCDAIFWNATFASQLVCAARVCVATVRVARRLRRKPMQFLRRNFLRRSFCLNIFFASHFFLRRSVFFCAAAKCVQSKGDIYEATGEQGLRV